jgi:hypothetical protein
MNIPSIDTKALDYSSEFGPVEVLLLIAILASLFAPLFFGISGIGRDRTAVVRHIFFGVTASVGIVALVLLTIAVVHDNAENNKKDAANAAVIKKGYPDLKVNSKVRACVKDVVTSRYTDAYCIVRRLEGSKAQELKFEEYDGKVIYTVSKSKKFGSS